MTLYEPATFATDLALALIAGWLAWRLQSKTTAENHAARWLSRTLAFTAASGVISADAIMVSPRIFPP